MCDFSQHRRLYLTKSYLSNAYSSYFLFKLTKTAKLKNANRRLKHLQPVFRVSLIGFSKRQQIMAGFLGVITTTNSIFLQNRCFSERQNENNYSFGYIDFFAKVCATKQKTASSLQDAIMETGGCGVSGAFSFSKSVLLLKFKNKM